MIEQAEEIAGDRMDVTSVMFVTDVAHSGMLVREFFKACGQAQVQALPDLDEAGRVTGRVTLKNVLRLS